MKGNKHTIRAVTFLSVFVCSMGQASMLTHGPMIGHTTDTTTRIWVRADGPCKMQVRFSSRGRTVVSETIRLVEENNFCGSAEVRDLSPRTTYSYRVFLDNKEQDSDVRQEITTFGHASEPGIIRVGFGHSLRGRGTQDIWKAVAAKKPDLFILMGDNIYSDSTEPAKQRRMYLQFRADRYFRAFGATTPIYAVWDDHDYGIDNSDRTQPGKERSLKTFNEIWPNPKSQAEQYPGIWTRFTVGGAEFFLMDVRYHRSANSDPDGPAKTMLGKERSLKTFNEIWPNPKSQAEQYPGIWTRFTVGGAEFFLMDVRYHRSANSDPDGPAKTMLGKEQLAWLKNSLASSKAVFKFPVSGSSWNCGGPEAWNHSFTYEYDGLVEHIASNKITGVILLGGDQHFCKIAVRPKESWGGYDLHEWMAGQLWNSKADRDRGYFRGFGLITLDTTIKPATARLEFFDRLGEPHQGRRILYTTLGALRALLDSPAGVTGVPKENLRYIDRLRPKTSGPLWEIMPVTTGEKLTEDDLEWPSGG